MIREGSIKRSRDVGVVARDPGGGGAGARTHVTSAERRGAEEEGMD